MKKPIPILAIALLTLLALVGWTVIVRSLLMFALYHVHPTVMAIFATFVASTYLSNKFAWAGIAVRDYIRQGKDA